MRAAGARGSITVPLWPGISRRLASGSHWLPVLSVIHCLTDRVKPKFLRMARKVFHDPGFQPVSCGCPTFAHIPVVFPYTCSGASVHVFSPSGMPFLLSLWTHTLPNINSGIILTRKDSQDPLIRTRYPFSVLLLCPGILILTKMYTRDFNHPVAALDLECLQSSELYPLSLDPQHPELECSQ